MINCARCDGIVRPSPTDETTQFVVQARHETQTGDLCADCTEEFYDFIREGRDE